MHINESVSANRCPTGEHVGKVSSWH